MRRTRSARRLHSGPAGYGVDSDPPPQELGGSLRFQHDSPEKVASGQIRARSLLGIVAKLEIIAGADRDIDDPTDFPWRHIVSVLADLKESPGACRLHGLSDPLFGRTAGDIKQRQPT